MSRVALVTLFGLVAMAASSLSAGAESLDTKRTILRDDTGELATGPDVTAVEVSSEAGVLRFRLSIPSNASLTDDLRIRVWLDADDDRSTGLDLAGKEGLDNFLLVERWQLGPGAVGLFRCDGSACTGGRRDSVDFSYASGATFTLDPRELGVGALTRFRFAVEVTAGIAFDEATRRYDFTNGRLDAAPREGSFWTYDTRVAVVERFATTPTLPAAGKRFSLRLRAIRTDTGAALSSGRLMCSCRIAGKRVRPRSRGFLEGQAECTFDIPAHARGKRFRSSIELRAPGTIIVRSVSGTIR
jgi:hypothetical protein